MCAESTMVKEAPVVLMLENRWDGECACALSFVSDKLLFIIVNLWYFFNLHLDFQMKITRIEVSYNVILSYTFLLSLQHH